MARLNGIFIYIRLTKLNRRQKSCSTPFSSSFLDVIFRCHDPSLYIQHILLSISSLSIFNPELHVVYVISNSQLKNYTWTRFQIQYVLSIEMVP